MWWFFKKIQESDTEIIYSYGRESRELTGELVYDKIGNEFYCNKIAIGDTEKGLVSTLEHLYGIIVDENAPDERMVCCG